MAKNWFVNQPGTGGSTPGCGCPNWIEHWARSTGSTPRPFCSNADCWESATDGGHVRLCNVGGTPTDPEVYILPLCRSCNSPKNTAAMPLRDEWKPARIGEFHSCDRLEDF